MRLMNRIYEMDKNIFVEYSCEFYYSFAYLKRRIIIK